MSTESLPEQQQRRLDRMYRERHFLLACRTLGANLEFDVSGSTGNLYTVSVNGQSRRFHCTCPDHGNWARRSGVECKHVCFAVYRVLRSRFDAAFFDAERARTVLPNDLSAWRQRARRLGQRLASRADGDAQLSGLVNKQYLERYQAHAQGANDAGGGAVKRSRKSSTSSFALSAEDLMAFGVFRAVELTASGDQTSDNVATNDDDDDDDECQVCFESLVEKSDAWLVCCGDRRHATHRDCMDRWLRENPTKGFCIHCRAPLAYAAWTQRSLGGARQRRKVAETLTPTIDPATGEPYVNLGRPQ